MTNYEEVAAAVADGYEFSHEPDRSRFVLRFRGEQVGEATYRRDASLGVTNFDHTFVDPAHRGTGLPELLVAFAVPTWAQAGDRIEADCWYVAKRIERDPGLLGEVRADEARPAR